MSSSAGRSQEDLSEEGYWYLRDGVTELVGSGSSYISDNKTKQKPTFKTFVKVPNRK